jgi:hypothetical protein
MIMSLQLINGAAAERAADDGLFEGTVSPRRVKFNDANLLTEAQKFLKRAFDGRVFERELREAFSTSDFTLAAFAAVDSEMMAQYRELDAVWRQYTTVTTVNDFRPKRLLDKWSNQIGLKRVPELTEYPTGLGGDHDTWFINVAKFGLRDAISFEALKNNEAIDELEDIPAKYARAALETETINALSNLLAVNEETGLANGVNTDFFKSGNGNAPDNKPLTAENLDAVLASMATKVSRNNKLIARPELMLLIPKSLEWQMKKIRALREIRVTDSDTTTVYDNYLTDVDYVVEPMLDRINTHNKAATTWFVLPKPNQPRPATFAAFLRGYESPDLRVKANQGNSLAGGAISPIEGSFDIDDIQYRVRHIVGHQVGDPTFTYVSLGS